MCLRAQATGLELLLPDQPNFVPCGTTDANVVRVCFSRCPYTVPIKTPKNTCGARIVRSISRVTRREQRRRRRRGIWGGLANPVYRVCIDWCCVTEVALCVCVSVCRQWT